MNRKERELKKLEYESKIQNAKLEGQMFAEINAAENANIPDELKKAIKLDAILNKKRKKEILDRQVYLKKKKIEKFYESFFKESEGSIESFSSTITGLSNCLKSISKTNT